MKIDRFSESIRRKLESIRPDFSESDWTRMQASLRQVTPPPSSSATARQPFTVSRGRPWLMAAAAVSFVVLVSFAAWQRAQIVTLRQTVDQLSQQTTRLRQPRPEIPANVVAPTPDQPTARPDELLPGSPNQLASRSNTPATQTDTPDRKPDTVYITRYVTRPQLTNPAPEQMAQRPVETNETGEPTIDHAALTDRTASQPSAPPRQQLSEPSATGGQNDDETTGGTVAGKSTGKPTATDVPVPSANGTAPTRPVRRGMAQKSSSQPTDRPEADRADRRNRPSPASANNDRTVAVDNTTTTNTSVSRDVSDKTPQPVELTEINSLATRPLSLAVINWNEALARQARRRLARTTTVGGQAAPVSQPVDPVAFGFRIGAGGELSRAVQSGGLLTELLIGKHLTLGVEIGMASFAGGSFTTDVEFDRQRPKKFRREYARNIDPRSDIVNIATRTVRLQIPITVGYRIPVGRTLSLLPTVGTTLGLQSKEFVTFTFRQPFRSFESASSDFIRPIDLFNNLTFGAGLEWKQNHWVLQAGPLLTIPTVADANWQKTASIGLRARLFYQF